MPALITPLFKKGMEIFKKKTLKTNCFRLKLGDLKGITDRNSGIHPKTCDFTFPTLFLLSTCSHSKSNSTYFL
jgi:hypothetical protein